MQEELVSGFSQFLDGDYGQGYRQQADYAFQNKDYIQWLLSSADGTMEAAVDIVLVPTAIITLVCALLSAE